MQRETLFVEMGTDALWSDLVRPSRSLLGPARILIDGARGSRPAGRDDHDGRDSAPDRPQPGSRRFSPAA